MEDYLSRVSAEQREQAEVLDYRKITQDNSTRTSLNNDRLLEEILLYNNLLEAARHVKKNKGACGIDGMNVNRLIPYLNENYYELRQQILAGKYKPNPVRRVEIPKGNTGKFRKLGIPTVADRMIQMAVTMVLEAIYEKQFSETSYGFRPGRGAHDALKKCIEYANEGYDYVVSIDLEKYFDTVNHSKLIEVLSRSIKDGRVISLIHKFLNAGIYVNGMFEKNEEGMPQGGCFSPLGGNVMLNELDKELERRGHRFIRYADDVLLMCRSRKAAERTMESIARFIEEKLFLKVNREKSTVSKLEDVKYLGYGFYRKKGEYRLRVHPKSVNRMKERLRELTKRGTMGNKKRIAKLKEYIRGWIDYFVLADMKTLMQTTDKWMRRRIRTLYWLQWKRVRTRYRKLRSLGLKEEYVHTIANARKGPTRMGETLNFAITNKTLKEWGYLFMSDYYSYQRKFVCLST